MKRLILLLLVILAFGLVSAQAQDDEYPLILWIRGDPVQRRCCWRRTRADYYRRDDFQSGALAGWHTDRV